MGLIPKVFMTQNTQFMTKQSYAFRELIKGIFHQAYELLRHCRLISKSFYDSKFTTKQAKLDGVFF